MSLEETIDMTITIPSHIHAILAKNGIANPLDTPLEIIELSSGRAFLSFGPLLTFVVHGKEWTHSAMAEAAQNEDDIKLLKGRIISLTCIKVRDLYSRYSLYSFSYSFRRFWFSEASAVPFAYNAKAPTTVTNAIARRT